MKVLTTIMLIVCVTSCLANTHRRSRYLQAPVSADTGSGSSATTPTPPPTTGGLIPSSRYQLSESERWIYGAVWTIVGIPLCFFGLKWWNFFAWIVGALLGIASGNFIQGLSQSWVSNTTWLWVCFGITVALAVTLAIIFICCKKMVGMFLGAYLGFIVYNAVASYISSSQNGKAPEWWVMLVVMGSAVVLGCLLGCWLADSIISVGSAVIGAWSFTCGVGTLLGMFPYAYVSVPAYAYWLFMGGFAVLATTGCVVQCIDQNKRKDKEYVAQVIS